MAGAWHYYNKPWMNSRLVAAGATAYGAGTTFNILETARVRAASEQSSQQLKKQHLLPVQVVQERIESLDAMQRSLDVIASKSGKNDQASVDTTH